MKPATEGMKPKGKKERRILLLYVVFIHILLVGIILWQFSSFKSLRNENHPGNNLEKNRVDEMIEIRSKDFKFTRPLRLTDIQQESGKLGFIKQSLVSLIDEKERQGLIINASVYLRKLDDGSWTSINENNGYKPGSIFKIPLLIYFLKLAETDKNVLKREIIYNNPICMPKNETYKDPTIDIGKKYTVKELLYHMIVNSDNIATTLLLLHLDHKDVFEKIYLDLGIPKPDPFDNNYRINASQCSKFLRVLYNSTYLSQEYSEYALELMTKSTFADGITKDLPKNQVVAHKFGESGDKDQPEFSETGIVFLPENNYLLTIMTRGNDVKQEAETVREISKMVYDKMREAY